MNVERVSDVDGGPTGLERAFLAALSVFVGGFTIEAAKAVAAVDPGIEAATVDDLVPALVRRVMIVEDATPARYHLADQVRSRSLDTLRSSARYDAVRDGHLGWARSYAEQGAAALDGPGQHLWLDAMDAEHANFRAALEWGTARRDCDAALGLAAALGRFWEVRGHVREGRSWLDLALRQNPGAPPAVRASASNSAGLLAVRSGDLGAARTLYDESLALHWDLDDRLGASGVLHALGNVAFQRRDWDEGKRLFEESLHIGRELRDDRVIAASLTNLGAVAEVRGDHASARALYDEALGLWQALGDSFNAAAVLANLAQVALARHDLVGARRLAGETLEARRLVGDKAGMASALRLLGVIALFQGDHQAARSFRAERRLLRGGTEGGWLVRTRRRWTS